MNSINKLLANDPTNHQIVKPSATAIAIVTKQILVHGDPRLKELSKSNK